MRISKAKKKIKGNLKGLSSRDYYALTNFKNPISLIRQIVGDELFKKFDRGKPLNVAQINKIEDALNLVTFEQTKSLIPYTTPLVIVKRKYDTSSTKSVYTFSGVSFFSLHKVKTDDGTGYQICLDKIAHKEFEGQVLFSKHAIDRLIERQPQLIELSKCDTGVIIKVMRQCIREASVGMGSVGPQLKCGPLGFFPMIWEKDLGMWMLTTFLEKDMRGTTDQVIQQMKSNWAELSRKYDVQRELPIGK